MSGGVGLKGEVFLYKAKSGEPALEVVLDKESVWLSLNQMAELFERDKSVISRHLRNIFHTGELRKKSVVAKNATTAADGKTYLVEFYNLDAILSVGYRVNSKRGTQFRVWATKTLKDHLIRGYTLNERRLREQGVDFEQALQLLSRTLTSHELVTDQGQAVLDVITHYAKSWLLLKQYDEESIRIPEKRQPQRVSLKDDDARRAIAMLKKELMTNNQATELFGQERGEGLAAALGAIEQTFGGRALYPSIEEKAAHLLYFIIKDHPFTDGNKRIGSFLFILYLRRNGFLENADGRLKINDNALVALALLIAESEPRHKDLMIRLIMNLLTEQTA